MQTNPMVPFTEHDVYGMAFMIGYLGDVPDELRNAFPEETFEVCPDFVPRDLMWEWRRGYDSGAAFFCDHALDEE